MGIGGSVIGERENEGKFFSFSYFSLSERKREMGLDDVINESEREKLERFCLNENLNL